jgi:hypothetical protein
MVRIVFMRPLLLAFTLNSEKYCAVNTRSMQAIIISGCIKDRSSFTFLIVFSHHDFSSLEIRIFLSCEMMLFGIIVISNYIKQIGMMVVCLLLLQILKQAN